MTEDTITPVALSERAAMRIAAILAKENKSAADGPVMLRVSVSGGGCSGFQYGFDFERTRAVDDLVLQRGDAVVLIDSTSLPFLEGAEIDFVDELIGASFRINNPNAASSCGCGTSFSI